MRKIVSIVQAGQFTNDQIKAMESGFRRIYRKHYAASERLVVLWMEMPEGYAYAERRASKATLIVVEVAEDMDQQKREELMQLFSKFLMEDFKVSPLDSVITVANASFVNGFFKAQQQRIDPLSRPIIGLKTIFRSVRSKWARGYLILPVQN